MSNGERCVAYQHRFLAAVKVREVVAHCKDGNDRNRIVARLDDAIEAMNNGIAENCDLEWSVSANSASALQRGRRSAEAKRMTPVDRS